MSYPLNVLDYEKQDYSDHHRNSEICSSPLGWICRFHHLITISMARYMKWALDPRQPKVQATTTAQPKPKATRQSYSKQTEED